MVLLNQRYHHSKSERMGATIAPGTVPTHDIEFNSDPIADTQGSGVSWGYRTINYEHQHKIPKPVKLGHRQDDRGRQMMMGSIVSLPEMTFSEPEAY